MTTAGDCKARAVMPDCAHTNAMRTQFPPLQLVPGASPRLAAALTALHGGACLCTAASALPMMLSLPLVALAGASLVATLRAHVLHRGDAITRVDASARRGWTVTTGRHPAVRAHPGAGALVLTGLVIVRFELEDGRRRTLLLAGDAVDADSLRRLRVLLRLPPRVRSARGRVADA
ncbi:MAG: hypothetical protein IT495_06300 [Gammaproteobacteria bacterium]|nr:hypothetical protein [Gammaproteobacteria bacterium]